jgi:nifR3 family TIM-barrel protein
MKNFWEKLKKPIFCLAPMADVTDCAFRQIIAKYGKPDVFWTEFVSADGLCHPVAREKLLIDFIYSENERPIVAQIFGGKPENIKQAAALCKELGFDGIDINMGCPAKEIEKQCAGSAMMKDPKLAREVIRAAIEGGGGLPVSVKTRIGYNKNEIETWIPELLKENISALTVHLRTRKEMSDVPAHWDLMKRVVEIRDEMKKDTLILGNGDVVDTDDARKKCEETGCDGVMLGRAIFGNPWLFADHQRAPLTRNSMSKVPFGKPSIKEKLQVMVEHTKLFEKMLGKHKNFAIMKKHYKAYANGFDGAKELRVKLMETETATQVEEIVDDFLIKIRA